MKKFPPVFLTVLTLFFLFSLFTFLRPEKVMANVCGYQTFQFHVGGGGGGYDACGVTNADFQCKYFYSPSCGSSCANWSGGCPWRITLNDGKPTTDHALVVTDPNNCGSQTALTCNLQIRWLFWGNGNEHHYIRQHWYDAAGQSIPVTKNFREYSGQIHDVNWTTVNGGSQESFRTDSGPAGNYGKVGEMFWNPSGQSPDTVTLNCGNQYTFDNWIWDNGNLYDSTSVFRGPACPHYSCSGASCILGLSGSGNYTSSNCDGACSAAPVCSVSGPTNPIINTNVTYNITSSNTTSAGAYQSLASQQWWMWNWGFNYPTCNGKDCNFSPSPPANFSSNNNYWLVCNGYKGSNQCTGSPFCNFNGANSCVAGDRSVAAWIKLSGTGVYQKIYSAWDNNNHGWALYLNPQNHLSLYTDLNGALESSGPSITADGQWHHVAAIWDSRGQAFLYVDGSNVAGGLSRFTPPNGDNQIGATCNPNCIQYFNGQIDEVGVWGRNLYPGDVSALWNGGNGRSLNSFDFIPGANTDSGNAVPLSQFLLSYWSLENSLTDSITGYNTTGINNPGYVTGKQGFAASFNGSNQYLNISNPSYINTTGCGDCAGWTDCGNFSRIPVAITNHPPTTQSVSISPTSVVANGTTQYTITNTVTDADGFADIIAVDSAVNLIKDYNNTDRSDFAGMIGWTTTQDNYPYWDSYDRFTQRLCSGDGGYAARNTQFAGNDKINLVGCSSFHSGNTRTITFTVTFNSNFISPATNYLWGWVMDSAWAADVISPNYYGWRKFDSFPFGSLPTCDFSSPPNTAIVGQSTPFTVNLHGSGIASAQMYYSDASANGSSFPTIGSDCGNTTPCTKSVSFPSAGSFWVVTNVQGSAGKCTSNPWCSGWPATNPPAGPRYDCPNWSDCGGSCRKLVTVTNSVGTLNVYSSPTGGSFFTNTIGGTFCSGTAPKTCNNLNPGTYNITFQNNLSGYSAPNPFNCPAFVAGGSADCTGTYTPLYYFQTSGGDVGSRGNISESYLPLGKFISAKVGGYAGIVAANTISPAGQESESGWKLTPYTINSSLTTGVDYASLLRNVAKNAGTSNNFDSICPISNVSAGGYTGLSGYTIYCYVPGDFNSALTAATAKNTTVNILYQALSSPANIPKIISTPIPVTTNSRTVVFVNDGILQPNASVTISNTSAGIIFVTQGDINVDPSVGRLDGVYLFPGTFSDSGTAALIGNGSLLKTETAGSFNFSRNFSGGPAESWTYEPKYLDLFKKILSTASYTWKELPPQ